MHVNSQLVLGFLFKVIEFFETPRVRGGERANAVVQCNGHSRRELASQHTLPRQKISLIGFVSVKRVSAIKLIRTDTTLDLSQKAEKV